MLLFKFFQQFLLPSVFVFILIVLGIIFLLKFKKRKAGRILVLTGIILYYLFSITPITDLILYPLENQYNPIDIRQVDAIDKIILLTGSKMERSSEILRIYFSKNAEVRGKMEIIITGTNALDVQNNNEAVKTKDYLTERGIPAENIIFEDKSRNTFESAENIKSLVGEQSFLLVTSAYHMPRAMLVFRKINTSPIAAPADFKIEGNYNLFDFFPNPQNLQNVDLAFHEYFGFLYYKIRLAFD